MSLWEILLADDHKLLREGLAPFLRDLDQELVVLEAADFTEARAVAASAQNLRLILLDLGMPGLTGMAGVEEFKANYPDVLLVILSGDARPATVAAALRAGASGFIPKTVSGLALTDALRVVLRGETYLPPGLVLADQDIKASDASDPPAQKLTPRDHEILALVVEGLTNKEIGRRLGLQEVTIKAHLRGLYRKIGAINRAQAVRITLESR